MIVWIIFNRIVMAGGQANSDESLNCHSVDSSLEYVDLDGPHHCFCRLPRRVFYNTIGRCLDIECYYCVKEVKKEPFGIDELQEVADQIKVEDDKKSDEGKEVQKPEEVPGPSKAPEASTPFDLRDALVVEQTMGVTKEMTVDVIQKDRRGRKCRRGKRTQWTKRAKKTEWAKRGMKRKQSKANPPIVIVGREATRKQPPRKAKKITQN
ncbi:hypothetical protein ECANGB1_2103 [Enterospora canceri]|uniref:Uncharacterized protein n=1 Tax=Enterospora canceri TaxID=1081671 RepID=A0A1Y1S8V5_9MICR|nr:hypothetical protein ECANGB1_2103 [Enterospora canceri]